VADPQMAIEDSSALKRCGQRGNSEKTQTVGPALKVPTFAGPYELFAAFCGAGLVNPLSGSPRSPPVSRIPLLNAAVMAHLEFARCCGFASRGWAGHSVQAVRSNGSPCLPILVAP